MPRSVTTPFLPIGVAFVILGLNGTVAFIYVGIAFLVLGISGLIRK